ncbi:MAG: ATP-binding cassette domain-containing protein [Myxococcota bacterium]|nr:ATP-binding cassette domain-containing protein [Myxococcota bacterium]
MLSVSNVRVRFPESDKPALHCPEITVAAGEIVALSGPSGCGKSTLGLAILGLLPADARLSGRITFRDLVLTELGERDRGGLRGRRIAWIPQDVGASLSPFHPVARQIAEVAEVHEGISRKVAHGRAATLLARLGIEDAGTRMREHPHRWSGGMLQRALISMALMTSPELVIADEPTSALDPTARQAVVDLFRERAGAGTGFLVITHDSALIAALQARVVYGVAPLSTSAG